MSSESGYKESIIVLGILFIVAIFAATQGGGNETDAVSDTEPELTKAEIQEIQLEKRLRELQEEYVDIQTELRTLRGV